MVEGTCGAYTAIEMGSATNPLISQTVKRQGGNNSPGAAPGVSVADDEESTPKERQEQQKIQDPKAFLSRFNAIFDDTTSNKQEKENDFKKLLDGYDVKLKNIYVQKAFVKMLNDIAKYTEFLKLFINCERFAAYNEGIETKYLINKDQNTMRDLDAPLHCAVRQLNEGFIEWLLEQPATEVNLRNKQKETALAILCQKYDCVSKLKTRLEDIEKERKTADNIQQIKLDDEKIKVSAQKEELEEKMNAPTILMLIKKLLEKGADFNIYMNDGALPFDFLRKYYKEAVLDEIINSYAKANVAITEKPPEQSNASAEGKNESKKRIVKFYKKTEDMDMRVTEKLLEIFIRFNDLEKFEHYWKDFKVTSDNVKKVITQLLHVAVKLNYTTFVDHIIKKASKEIFKLDGNKETDIQDHTFLPGGINPHLPNAEENKMVHRNELKGLLNTVCRNGNKALLTLFLEKMNDRLLVKQNPLLINTLNGAYTMKSKKESIFLLECMKILINNHRKVDMYRVDRNGNTALHLALSYGYDTIALLMLKKVHGLMGFRNRLNLTPIEYGTTDFWNSYLNNCITNKDESELRFNVGFLKPRATNESSDTSKSSSSKGHSRSIASSIWFSIRYCFCLVKRVEEMNETHNSRYRFTRTVNDMTALRLISQSKDRKEFLMHPVIIAFITMKWKRLCHWHILNLLLTIITMGAFIAYTLMPCPSGEWKYGVIAGIGAYIITVREIMQFVLLQWTYITLTNIVNMMKLSIIGIVLGCGCDRDEWCEAVPIFSAFVVVSLSLQATFLLGASWNNLSITLYMFKTVSSSFFYSFLYFTPVIGAFIYSFYRTNNDPSDVSTSYCPQHNCSEENFNNFPSFWKATIKTLVMTTGEFEAANIDFDGGKWILFVAFVFIAPIVILNLINGIAVSDIADIRKESEFISIYKKVKLLELYDRAIFDSRFTMPGYLQWLFREPLSPSPFFVNYESVIYVMVNETNKLAIKSKKKEKSTKESIPVSPVMEDEVPQESNVDRSTSNNNDIGNEPGEESTPTDNASNENLVSSGTTPASNNQEDVVRRPQESNNDRSTSNNNDTGNERGEESTPTNNTTPSKGSAKIASNDLQLIPVFPWLPSCWLKYYIGIRSFQLVLYMSLDQSYVDKAKTITKSQLKNNSARVTNELADTEQTDGPALVNKTAMNQHKTSTLSRSATGPSVPDSRDKQIEKLQGQVQNIIAMLTDIQQQLAGSHPSKAESTASTSGDHSRVQ